MARRIYDHPWDGLRPNLRKVPDKRLGFLPWPYSFPPSWSVDKPTLPTYYSSIMASERLQRQIDVLLDEAEAAIKQLDWRVVHDRSQAVLAMDPENSDGLAFLATAERALNTSAPAPIWFPLPGCCIMPQASCLGWSVLLRPKGWLVGSPFYL